MKKLFLSAAVLAFAGLATAKANNITNSSDVAKTAVVTSVQDSTKTPVKLDELPDSVKTALASDAYMAWTPTEAFWVKDDAGMAYYEITATKDDQTAVIKLDKEGKPVE